MFDIIPFKKNDVSRRKNIFQEIEDVMDSMFQDFDACFGSKCYEVGDGIYTIQIEVPGFNKDNLTVEVGDGMATIKGEREFDQKKHIGQNKVFKRLSIGEPDDVNASIKDGILTLTLKYPVTADSKKKINISDEKEPVESTENDEEVVEVS
jgi:HSP20 family molecular chaperone IbpA